MQTNDCVADCLLITLFSLNMAFRQRRDMSILSLGPISVGFVAGIVCIIPIPRVSRWWVVISVFRSRAVDWGKGDATARWALREIVPEQGDYW